MNTFKMFFLAILSFLIMSACGSGGDGYTGGGGRVSNEIRTPQDFYNIRNNLSGNYKLVNDIDLSGYSSGSGWHPIGIDSPFEGILDGNGYKVINLKINNSDDNCIGLFGYINNAVIKNLKVETLGIVVSSSDIIQAGIIAGCLSDSVIENSSTRGDISIYTSSDYSYAGGITGVNVGNITKSYSTGAISSNASNSSFAGGIAGENGYDDSNIKNNVVANSNITSNASYNHCNQVVGGISTNVSNNYALSSMIVCSSNFGSAGISTSENALKTQATYEGLGWKFGNDDDNPWKMPVKGGFPILYWQKDV